MDILSWLTDLPLCLTMGRTVFQLEWLAKYEWIAQVKGQNHKFRCTSCKTENEIGKMAENAVISHSKSARHLKNVKLLRNMTSLHLFSHAQPKEDCRTAVRNRDNAAVSSASRVPNESAGATASEETIPTVFELPVHAAASIPNWTVTSETLEAEILWTFKCISDHLSYKSNEDIGIWFKRMFPDSQIAKKFTCGEKKTAYLCVFGIAPYLRDQLMKAVKGPYTILFDESLNHKMQAKQLDIHIRYWADDRTVKTSYLTSDFLGEYLFFLYFVLFIRK